MADTRTLLTPIEVRALLASGIDSTVVLDGAGVVVAASDSAGDSFGIDAEAWVGRPAIELVHPEDAASAMASLAETIAGPGRREPIRLRIRDSGGNWRPVELVGNSIADHGGVVVLNVRDRTGELDHEEWVHNRTQLYRQVVEMAAEGVWVIDGEFATTFVSESMGGMLGWKAEEMLGRKVWDFMDEAGRKVLQEKIATASESIRDTRVYRLLHRDGRTIWVRVNSNDLGVGDTYQGTIAVVTDITAHHLEHERLAQERAHQKGLLDAIPDLMFRLDRRGTYVGYHGGREADLLLPPEEFLGRTVSEVLPADVADSIARAIEAALDGNQLQIVEYDLEIGGTASTYEARISASGSDTVVAIVRDLTALRDAERARRDLLVEIHRREDAEARAELDQRLHQAARLEALGRLSGGVAHDVNNLLGVIGNYVAVVRRSTFDPTILDDLGEIENAVRRGSELTKRLLLVGRREQSEPVELPVSGVVGDICRVLSRAGDASVPIRTDLAAPDLQVLLDRTQLEQAVVNLVINAQDASPSQGEVVVRVAEEPRCEGIDSDRVVTVSVSDSGPGVPPELRSSVLEPFFTTKGPGRGTGLGLAVVHGVVSEAGGVLRIEDVEGGGARMSMLFPATVVEAPGVEGQTPRGQLLVVDDDPDSLRSTARLIGSHGVEVVTATSAEDAISALEDHPEVVAVLSDVVMPGRSGIELDRELRSLHPDMEVILMTGHVNRSDELPRDRTVLSKPLEIEELLDSLGALVRH